LIYIQLQLCSSRAHYSQCYRLFNEWYRKPHNLWWLTELIVFFFFSSVIFIKFRTDSVYIFVQYISQINTLNDIDKIENILNPTSSQQVKSLGSFIKRLWNWGQGALDYICYIVKQPFCLFIHVFDPFFVSL